MKKITKRKLKKMLDDIFNRYRKAFDDLAKYDRGELPTTKSDK